MPSHLLGRIIWFRPQSCVKWYSICHLSLIVKQGKSKYFVLHGFSCFTIKACLINLYTNILQCPYCRESSSRHSRSRSRISSNIIMRLMRALKCDASRGELSLEDVSIPEVILPDDVVIKVGYAGLCGTDLHIMQGEFAVCGSAKVEQRFWMDGAVLTVQCVVRRRDVWR